jgi:hypothetical protein
MTFDNQRIQIGQLHIEECGNCALDLLIGSALLYLENVECDIATIAFESNVHDIAV